ncbi:MAG TPA: tetratricopeptide repeat protein [Verrucomicrobiae bacterium]|nr:tetratricopeptide repeat protein [Verrucomicrobiae bacterium]
MVRFWRYFAIIFPLIFGGARLVSAASSETRAFRAASKNFQLGFWDLAEKNFAAFVTNFPDSTLVPEANLYRGEAAITNGNFREGIEILSTNEIHAGKWADKYADWMAWAYLASSNYPAAAETYGRLVEHFPESSNRLEACVGQATALSRLGQWSRVSDLLGKRDSIFRQLASGRTNDLVVAGYLLLGEAELAQNDFTGAHDALELLTKQHLKSDAAWRRWYLQCRLEIAEGKTEQASSSTTNLIALADLTKDPELQAETVDLQAEIMEHLGKWDDAISLYRKNTSTNAPVEQQRDALLKIAQISLAQGKAADAVKTLGDFWNQYPKSAAADMALLALGEVQLKRNLTGAETNRAEFLKSALDHFDTLLNTFTNSPLTGKALLDKGWCLWEQQKYSESEPAFRGAAERLSVSTDQAVARFKWGDAQFMQRNFSGALTNYHFVIANYASDPEVKTRFLEQALYQTCRAALEANNISAATNAVLKILNWYPNGFAGDRCLLLLGETVSHQGDSARARDIFSRIETAFPITNSLMPEVRLAIARSYEQQNNWTAAITNYQSWISDYTNNNLLPRAEFSRAWDTAMAGQETNALVLFTNFVARFETNDLAPQAQWWIGDYYFRQGDASGFYNAESSYQNLFTKWPSSPLACEARMMAGRSAVARLSYKDAIDYFTGLVANTNCPHDVRIQARFATGDTFMSRTDSAPTNKMSDVKEALSWFESIAKLFPTNASAPIALGRMGDCYKELAALDDAKAEENYAKAADLYQQVIASPIAGVSARSQAKVGLGIIAEKRADKKNDPALLEQALANYLAVFSREDGLRDGETPDLFWVREAGLKAARVAEQLKKWKPARDIYKELRDSFPALGTTLDAKILNAEKQLNTASK